MSFKPRFGKNRIKENVNEGIRVPEVRTIFPDGSNQVLPTHQAIQKAKALNLDLILVSPNVKPPVAKILDHGR
jgi:translation initiation factor IF-3